MPLPCMRTDRPRPDPSPHRQELLDDLDELDSAIRAVVTVSIQFLDGTGAAAHAGGLEKERIYELAVEFWRDVMHREREWLENRLEEVR